MGVRGLQTFLEQYCPCACPTVNVTNLARKYKNETGKDPVIVMDTQTLYWTWCKGMDWIIGYEIQELLHRLRIFVESFQKIGVKIVFFVGGVAVEKKRNRLFNRRLKNIRDMFKLCDFLEKRSSTRFIPEEYVSLPPSMGLYTSMLLKHVLKCEVYATVEECTQEIIEYVHKNECMAILTQDSDFIVSDINECIVLSAREFDQRSMTTLLYDSDALAMILKITTDQLPLLAILAGNDCIEYEILKSFHRSICKVKHPNKVPYKILMPAIGRYLNNMLSDWSIDKILESICMKVFGNKSSFDSVKCSYNGYLSQKKPDDPKITNPSTKWSEILDVARDLHRNVIAPSLIWGILKDQFFELPVVFEDLRKSSGGQASGDLFVPSATITRLLRQRMYGILLYEYERLNDVQITEWCAENVLSYRQPVLVKPIAPTVQHPGLLQLWSNSNELGEIKWKLFLSCISPSIISIDNWNSLTSDLVGISATLFYLIEQNFINEDEMHAVMAAVATYSLYSREKLNDLDYGGYQPRCTHVSVCVIRTFTFVVSLMAACGYPVPLSGELIHLKFEGKLFQIKFKEMKQKKTIDEMCEKNDKCIEIFNQIKKVLSPAVQEDSFKELEDKGLEKQADWGDHLETKLLEMKVLK